MTDEIFYKQGIYLEGSTVTTCNDIGACDNSTILAMGASMPMPVIINPKNMKEYQEERAKQNPKKPEFTAAKWGKGTAKEGEEVELSAQVKDIDDGNMVTFQVWKEGQDPNSHIAQAQLPTNIEGGTAKAQWQCRPVDQGDGPPPEADPQFFFTVHSAWCPYKKSGNVTVELKRPELSNPAWQDQDGKGTDKGLVGEALKMAVSCNADVDEGAYITFRVYSEGANTARKDTIVDEVTIKNEGGTASAEWAPVEIREEGDTNKLKYFFTAVSRHCVKAESSLIPVKNPRILEMVWEPKGIYYGDELHIKIKSIEVADLSPEITVKLMDNNVHENGTIRNRSRGSCHKIASSDCFEAILSRIRL